MGGRQRKVSHQTKPSALNHPATITAHEFGCSHVQLSRTQEQHFSRFKPEDNSQLLKNSGGLGIEKAHGYNLSY